MKHTITLIPGDGIGPEVSRAVQRILAAAGVSIAWEETSARGDIDQPDSQLMNTKLVESIRKNRVALKGPLATAVALGPPSINVALRKALDLYANVRPVKNLEGVQSRFKDVDMVLIRENTEDLYAGLEHEVVPGVVESLKIITERASTRIARFAFEYARKRGRKKIHGIHKANIMKLSDGLFLDCARQIHDEEFPGIEYREIIIDAGCMRLVQDPTRFDVLLMENLYGDLVSDLCAGMVGGLGVVPGSNIGDDVAIFEAVHGSAPDIAGQGIANPLALIMSGVMMLNHLQETSIAEKIKHAYDAVLADGNHLTGDLGGSTTTDDFADAIIAKL